MATYFHGGAEMQAATGGGGGDNLQTLYLMNPNYATSSGYYEGHHQLLLNSTVTPNTLNMPHQPPHHQPHQQLVGIPLSGPHHSSDPARLSQFNNSNSNSNSNSNNSQIPAGMHGLALQRAHYNIWSPTSGSSQGQPGPIHDLSGQAGFRSPGQGGLSLSLSPGERGHHRPAIGGEDVRMSVTVASGPGSGNGVIMGSKYLRATQELLEEVVNVGGILGDNGESSGVHKLNKSKGAIKDNDDDMAGVEHGGDGESSKKGAELSTAQRQELQMKKAKLLNMLDEVEQRYRQYHTQMQVIASSFEQAAGIGSSKTYTSLALKTISKQFRCLKDAITSQIKATSKSLGEDDNNGGVKLEGGAGSRLRFVDQQLRQQRALQQLGMMHQHNAWRPQRGLPERAVSVLRAWLFEHFLHPYPKDSDKHMLAKQTGLTRSQVSNWFINARVRLWKPMVEEMYVEEMKSHEQNGGTSEENTNTTTTTTNNNGGIGSSSSKNEHNQDHYSTTTKTTMIPQQHEQQPPPEEDNNNNGGFSMIQTHQNDHNHHQTTNDMISTLSQSQGFTLIGSSSDMESLMARNSQKKQRSNSDINNSPSSILSMDMEMKPIDHTRHHSSMISSGGVGFNPYIVNDIGRFNPEQLNPGYHGNGVSLTLGLPHGDNLSMSDNHQQNFFPNQGMELGRRLDIGPGEADFCGISMGQTSHPTSNEYESIDIQSRKRFAAQILHDFVA
ncbi:BEL1-like homeodomain protein 1 [Silene latifolia]|uniref:BEL1-like homeodomain protein 1 n=1 Tax=Silene latifolia TaxID=37657 RepID=UPI003D775031